jgi:diguanylate cyclase (GGDEF)-like protein
LRRLPLDARLALVQAFATELNGCTRLGDLTDVLGDAARWILGCGHVSLALPEEENKDLYYRLQVAYDETADAAQPITVRAPLSEGLAGYALRTGEPVFLADLAADEPRSALLEDGWVAQGLHSATVLPLWWGGRVIGALLFASTELPNPAAIDGRLASLIATQAAPALNSVLLHRKLQRLALLDELTTLPNRRHLEWRLQTDCLRAARYGTPLSLLLIDVDRFHEINENCGYHTGNQILQALSFLVNSRTRRADLVARLEGDMLAVVLPETDAQAAQTVGEYLRTAVTNARLLGNAPPACRRDVTVSIGVAVYTPEMADLDALLLAAQMALDAAKALGGDCVETAPATL